MYQSLLYRHQGGRGGEKRKGWECSRQGNVDQEVARASRNDGCSSGREQDGHWALHGARVQQQVAGKREKTEGDNEGNGVSLAARAPDAMEVTECLPRTRMISDVFAIAALE